MLELEYPGTQEESERFDELLRNAAGYTAVREIYRRSRCSNSNFQETVGYLGEANPLQNKYDYLGVEYGHDSTGEE